MIIASAEPRKIPCLSDILTSFPVSHAWKGIAFHIPMNAMELTVLMVRNKLTKKAGTACAGSVSGLTRISTAISEVEEKMAERMMPKSKEFIRIYFSIFHFPLSIFHFHIFH